MSTTSLTFPTTEEEMWRYSRIDELDLAAFRHGTTRTVIEHADEVRLDGHDAQSCLGIAMVNAVDVFAQLNTDNAAPIGLKVGRNIVVPHTVVITHHLGKYNVLVLADGAHVPGALALDVPSIGVDWYAANLHKWCHAPRSCGFLWAPPERQEGLHPWTISWGLDQGFTKEFDWVGTLDPTNYLAAPDGVALLREWDFEAVRGYMHRLAWDGARLLTRTWDTELGQPEEMVGTMVTVPLPERAGSDMDAAARLRLELLLEDKIEIQMHAYRGRLWVRLSAQVYNEMDDVARLAMAVSRRL